MLKLKNVSKFYYSKGVIATGFSRVNIEFNIGEFVAIVGESGSGKSTLLNVISGLDSYEEGEMYINGEETSHYRESDFEEYRKKYVSNIFQSFNLVNSYNVYQNIELVLLLNGYKRKDVKKKVLELIDQVGLKKYRKTKVSRLSGGQRQRVAIARALAKDTPIIVCDEPTGNLDSKSAKDVIKLLKDISKNKLVIVVTHNFSEIEDLATRVVKMHDGKIISDKEVVKVDKVDEKYENKNKHIGIFNMIRLGIRNTFNIIPKFVLMFIVFLFVTSSLLSTYGSMQKTEYEQEKLGFNYYFTDTRDTRIVIKKNDGSAISKDDFDKIRKVDNISEVIEHDIMLDSDVWFETIDDSYFNINGTLHDLNSFSGELDYGRMPEADNEAIYVVSNYDYYFAEKINEAVQKEYYYNGNKSGHQIKIVGVKYFDENLFSTTEKNEIYLNSNMISRFMKDINRGHSKIDVYINGTNHSAENEMGFDIRTSDMVTRGNVYMPESLEYVCKDNECANKWLTLKIKNLYFSEDKDLYIERTYNEKNVNRLLNISKDDNNYGYIFMNTYDYVDLFSKDSYQASVIANDVKNVDEVSNKLEEMGYSTLQIRKTLESLNLDLAKALKIMKLVVLVFMVVTLFFISYFVIKLILKSRNVYFSTLRILGANARSVKRILDIELFMNASLAYLTYLILTILVKNNIIEINAINKILGYVSIRDYILMYIILVLMSYLISTRFARKIFKNSAMSTYREEV